MRQDAFLRNTNKAKLYLCLQEQEPKAERYFLALYVMVIFVPRPIHYFMTAIINHFLLKRKCEFLPEKRPQKDMN